MRTIKILSAGPIRTMGMIHGPILTPYTVDDVKLKSLIREGLNIVEILPDKTEKKLTMADINSEPIKVKKDTPTQVKEEKPVEEKTENTESIEIDEDIDNVSEEQHRPARKNKHKK